MVRGSFESLQLVAVGGSVAILLQMVVVESDGGELQVVGRSCR